MDFFVFMVFWICCNICNVWSRTTLIYTYRHDNNTREWNELVQEVSNHRINITYISMCSYRVESDASFGYQTSNGIQSGLIMEEWTVQFQKLGVQIMPLIDCSSSNAATKLMQNKDLQTKFINDAVNKAVNMNYSGYNLDWEVRVNSQIGKLYIDFIADFASSLHNKQKVLTASIAGYCPPWYMGATCPQLASSSFDLLYTMDTYQQDPATFRKNVQDSVKDFGSKAATGMSNTQDPNNLNSQSQLTFVKQNGINDLAVWVLTDPWGNTSPFWDDLGFFLQ